MAVRTYPDNPIREIVMTMKTGEVYTLPVDRIEHLQIDYVAVPFGGAEFHNIPPDMYIEIRVRVEAGRWTREYRPLPDDDDKALPMRPALPGPTD
jgi:hypothetical protein